MSPSTSSVRSGSSTMVRLVAAKSGYGRSTHCVAATKLCKSTTTHTISLTSALVDVVRIEVGVPVAGLDVLHVALLRPRVEELPVWPARVPEICDSRGFVDVSDSTHIASVPSNFSSPSTSIVTPGYRGGSMHSLATEKVMLFQTLQRLLACYSHVTHSGHGYGGRKKPVGVQAAVVV